MVWHKQNSNYHQFITNKDSTDEPNSIYYKQTEDNTNTVHYKQFDTSNAWDNAANEPNFI